MLISKLLCRSHSQSGSGCNLEMQNYWSDCEIVLSEWKKLESVWGVGGRVF